MPRYLSPGVYVEETSFRATSIEGLGTSTAAFVGPTLEGPVLFEDGGNPPPLITSFIEFERHYGDLGNLPDGAEGEPSAINHVAYAARAFFQEGGQRLYISRTPEGDLSLASFERALEAIGALKDVCMVAAPGSTVPGAARALVAHADRPQAWRMAVIDPPPGSSIEQVRAFRSELDSRNAALYYPWILSAASDGQDIVLPPSGFLCGIYARTDVQRGVHKAPANEVVKGARRFESTINVGQQEVLNPLGVNCLRYFEGRGYRVWGARTLSSDPEWKYVNLRRYCHYLESSIHRGMQWVALEPNGERLWANVRSTIMDFLYNEWSNGALLGSKPEEAYFVKCDRSTMTQNDLDNGRVVCLIGLAMVKPAEFTVFHVQRLASTAPGP